MADIEEIIDLYAQIPTFHPDYKPIINQMPPKKSDQIEQYLRNKLIVYNNAKSQKAFLYSIDTGMHTENSTFLDKAIQTDSLDKATQTEDIDFLAKLEQIKKANTLLINAINILSNI
ncbi:13607_t:CDS:2 [Funneliformis geosporum]|nr:13607_t:CDS:2 [Funneliformis geosporum]